LSTPPLPSTREEVLEAHPRLRAKHRGWRGYRRRRGSKRRRFFFSEARDLAAGSGRLRLASFDPKAFKSVVYFLYAGTVPRGANEE